MAQKISLVFSLPLKPLKPKILALHPTKEWMALITSNNTFYLWNYQSKILVKSFDCQSLADSKSIEIKELIFYDKESADSQSHIKNCILFASSHRIFLYDYMSEGIKQIIEKDSDSKTIKKLCIYTENQLCIGFSDGSIKVICIGEAFNENQSLPARTIRGYHKRAVDHIITYKQNQNDLPRIITVSKSDGMMACWNLATSGMKQNWKPKSQKINENTTPSFKFLMKSKENISVDSGTDSNNGEEILSIQYNSSNYHLLTLTHSYITVWSTMTGMELKRFSNVEQFKSILFFNHFCFGHLAAIAHKFTSTVYIVPIDFKANNLQVQTQIHLPDITRDPSSLGELYNLQKNPSDLFIMTNDQVAVLQIDKFYRPSYGWHPFFVTKLTTLNERHFMVKAGSCYEFQKDIPKKQITEIQFEEDILYSTFYLSCYGGEVFFNLIQIQFQNMLHEERKYRLFSIEEKKKDSPLITQRLLSQIIVSHDATSFAIFSKPLEYFELYSTRGEHIDFYSSFDLVASGICKSFVWHQFKNQYAVLQGFLPNNETLDAAYRKENKRIEKGSIQKFKEVGWKVCIYSKNSSGSYSLASMSPLIELDPRQQPFRLFGMGFIYAYGTLKINPEQKFTQKNFVLEYFPLSSFKQKDMNGMVICPQRILISYCQSFQVFVYQDFFVIYKVQENGYLAYFRSVQTTVKTGSIQLLQGIFWQKFLFYATKDSIYFLQITNDDLVQIKIASSLAQTRKNKLGLEGDTIDDLEPQTILRRPNGHIQLLGIVNMHLMVLKESAKIQVLDLCNFPYIQFCLEVAAGYSQGRQQIYQRATSEIKRLMKETMDSYGVVTQD